MVILTMLGTGNYQATTYEWDSRQAKVDLFPLALHRWFPDAQVKVLVTKEAREKYESGSINIPNATLIDIKIDEPWGVYQEIAASVPANESVILDITHGFRALPMLAMFSIAFLRAANQVKLERVLYGAFEAKQNDVTPVWDLTPFVLMLDWANATDRFLETGDTRNFKDLIQTRGRIPTSVDLNAVSGSLEPLSQALAFNRPKDVAEQAKKVLDRIAAAKSQIWDAEHEPFRLILDQLKSGLEPLVAGTKTKDVLRAQFELIRWFEGHGQYEKAAALAREWLVSLRVWERGGMVFPVNEDQRRVVEVWLNSNTVETASEEWTDALKLWRNLGDLRNDLMHCGMRPQPRALNALPKQVRDRVNDLAAVAKLFGILP